MAQIIGYKKDANGSWDYSQPLYAASAPVANTAIKPAITSAPPVLTKVATGSIGADQKPIYDVFAGAEHIKDPNDSRLAGKNIADLPSGVAPAGFKSQFKPITDASQVSNLNEAKTFINSGQEADAASVSAKDEPPVRKTVEDYMTEIKKANETLSGGATKPAAPDYTKQYTDLRGTYGVGTLEDKLNTLNTDLETANANYLAEKSKIESAPEAMNVIEGRTGEAAKAYQDKIDFINRQKNTVVNELQTKTTIISNLMGYKQLDYQAASAQYDKQFSQSIQTYNLLKGIDDANKSEAEKTADNARANAQIYINAMTARGETFDNLKPESKIMLQTLGMQAGLGTTFFSEVMNSSAGKEIKSVLVSDDKSQRTILYADGTSKVENTGLSPDVNTSVVEINGRKVLIDSKTGATVKDLGVATSVLDNKPLSSTLTTRYYLPVNTSQGDYDAVLQTIGALQNRTDLTDMEKWDAAAKAITAAGGDSTTWDAMLWENFDPEGLKGYLKNKKNVQDKTTTKRSPLFVSSSQDHD